MERAAGCQADASAESFRIGAPAASVVFSGLPVLPPLGRDETGRGDSDDFLASVGGMGPCFASDLDWREGLGLRDDLVCSAPSGAMTGRGRSVIRRTLVALGDLIAAPELLARRALPTRPELVASEGRPSLCTEPAFCSGAGCNGLDCLSTD